MPCLGSGCGTCLCVSDRRGSAGARLLPQLRLQLEWHDAGGRLRLADGGVDRPRPALARHVRLRHQVSAGGARSVQERSGQSKDQVSEILRGLVIRCQVSERARSVKGVKSRSQQPTNQEYWVSHLFRSVRIVWLVHVRSLNWSSHKLHSRSGQACRAGQSPASVTVSAITRF